MKRVEIRVKGRVQGVFYRVNTQEQAEKLGLTGWVRNTPDGTVEIVAEGEEAKLRSFVDWCRRGPTSAHVEDIRVNFSDATGDFESFNIKYF